MDSRFNFKNLKWSRSLQKMIPLLFIFLFASTLLTVYVVNQFIAKDKFIKESYLRMTEKGKTVSNGLLRDLAYAESLAKSMAQAALALPNDEKLFKDTFPSFFVDNRISSLIAGGGIWPMPYKFDPKKVRSSFFWGKNNATEEFEFFNDYNDPKGAGYHNEEWYVPNQFVQKNSAYWSRSYVDPYSKEAMVTVSVPYKNQKEILGVSTIDLKLSRLQLMLEREADSIKGYIVLLDRNNKILSFPKSEIIKENEVRNSKDNEYINYDLFVKKYSLYQPILNTLTSFDRESLVETEHEAKVIETLKKQITGIDHKEARSISYTIKNVSSDEILELGQFRLKEDSLLDEEVLISIFQIPQTHWKLVVASPVSYALGNANSLFYKLTGALFVVLCGLIACVYFFFQEKLVRPLKVMGQTLEDFDEDNESKYLDLPIVSNNELGHISELINERTQKLKKEKRAADNATKVKSQFLAAMSHEIRTPLNGIIGVLEILRETKLSKEQDELTSIINTSSRSLMTIINDVLDFSKLEEFKLKIRKRPYSIKELVDECVSLYVGSIKIKGVEVQVDYSKELPEHINIDDVRVKQVLNNLLSNAIKFTEKGKINIDISEKKLAENEYIIYMSVKDSGIGISKEDQDELFQSFSQIDTGHTRHYGGTGLGLTISQKICLLMGGNVEVDSKIGVGSTFIASFKASKAQKKSSASEVKDNNVSNELPISTPVLIVEDNLINQKVLGKLLGKLGFSYEVANNGVEALEKLEKNSFPVIFMDMQMPVMDGLECTSKIREVYSDDKHFIVALTANALDEDRRKSLEVGANLFETKPITKEKLTTILKTYSEECLTKMVG